MRIIVNICVAQSTIVKETRWESFEADKLAGIVTGEPSAQPTKSRGFRGGCLAMPELLPALNVKASYQTMSSVVDKG
jgi:hypothetical protein